MEDSPHCRASNHFHNPIIPNWLDAGVQDIPGPIKIWCAPGSYPVDAATSCLFWGTRYYMPGEKISVSRNPHDWDAVREGYYSVMSGKDFSGTQIWSYNQSDEKKRELKFFFTDLGYVLHLLQDMAVPAHVRSDFLSHVQWAGINWGNLWNPFKWVEEKYEHYTMENDKKLFQMINTLAVPNTVLTDPAVWKFWDTESYNGSSTDPGSLDFSELGLAEFTNLNFCSLNTFFTHNLDPDDNYYQPYPRHENTTITTYVLELPEILLDKAGVPASFQYVKKKGEGEVDGYGPKVDRFMLPGYFSEYVAEEIQIDSPPDWKRIYTKTFMIDDSCAENYATILLPKAISYSAALLEYFFRGEVDLTIDQDLFRIVNPTEELMAGRFELYYDTVNDERKPVTCVEKWPWSYEGYISAGDQSENLDLFAPPGDAKTPGEYMVVFNGAMGQEEENAVAAATVNIPAIQITLPDEGYYAFTDEHPFHDPSDPKYMEDPATGGFGKIVIDAENVSPEVGEMNGGTATLVVKYRQGLGNQFISPPGMINIEFSSIVVTLPDFVSIPIGSTTRLEFDLAGQQIPLWATDVHLFLIYNGAVGDESDMACLGYKDISEPTPYDFYNVMDTICLGGNLYDAGSEAAIAFVDEDEDGIAYEWDVYDHQVRDMSIQFSDNGDYKYDIPLIEPGDSFRIFVLIDYDDFDMTVSYYKRKLKVDDPFIHSGKLTNVSAHHGVTNQVTKEDVAGCPFPPCLVRHHSTFDVFRGLNVWGGFVVSNHPYPRDSECSYEE